MDETEWIVNANEAIEISLENGSEAVTFNPKFTYPIMGDAEAIVGYRGLNIKIRFDAYTLLPLVQMTYDEKLGDDIEDPLDKLREFMEWETDEKVWNKKRNDKILEISHTSELQGSDGQLYDLVHTNMESSRDFHLRMRIFVLFFIEAGSYIDETDERWDLYLIFSKNDKTFVGFSTVYPYFWYKDAVSHDASEDSLSAIRKRISQFVILPPFQSRGLGSKLYSALVGEFLADKDVREITVEDPSEAFDDLRDRCDLQRLAQAGVWINLSLPADPSWAFTTRLDQKMAPRQFDRCVEMAALHNSASKYGNKKYRLAVKKRLYIRNREALQELDKASRFDKLQETYDRLLEDYRRIMEKVDFSSDKRGKGKRKLDEA